MKRDFNPVDVELSIENPSIERGAFYRLCFITESNIAPRTLKVTRLQDLLDNGYSRLDLAYNFCVGVFSQQGIDTVYIRAKRSSESYVEAYNSEDNSMYYFVVLQTKDLTEIEKFNSHLVNSDEMKLQFLSQNVGSKTLQSPKLVNYYQDYNRPEGGVSSDDRDFYLNSAYEGLVTQIKLSLPDYLLSGLGDIAIEYGIYNMTGKKQIWEIDKAGRRIRYAPEVLQQGWVGSKEESTVNGSDITVVAYKGSVGVSKKSTILNPKVKIETLSRELLKGSGKEVLDYAIPLIDPEAKDWVLDAVNNAIKYTVDITDDGSVSASNQYRYYIVGSGSGVYYSSPESACLAQDTGSSKKDGVRENGTDTWGCLLIDVNGNGVWGDGVTREVNPAYDPSTPTTEDKYIPIDVVAAKVISNAEAGHTESKEFLKSIPLFAYLLTGSGTEAVNKAVLDINPEATDWVLDPANNRVKYAVSGGGGSGGDSPLSNGDKACRQAAENAYGSDNIWTKNARYRYHDGDHQCHTDGDFTFVFTNLTVAPDPDPEPEPVEKYLPIDTVAAKVISNAEAGHTPSQEALRLSTVERVNTGDYDVALEAASSATATWKYLPIFDVAVQVKRNSIAGHAGSIEAVNNSLPFELPNYEPVVTITGIAKVGETLTATVTDANGLPSNINYQWYADGVVISGATAETYVLKEAEAGKVITVRAKFTDSDGFDETVTSAASEVVQPLPEPTIKPLTFSTTNHLSDTNELPLNIRLSKDITEWQLKESGVLVADSEGFRTTGISLTIDGNLQNISLNTLGKNKNYEFFASTKWVSLSRGKISSINADGIVDVISYSTGINNHILNLENTLLNVPDTLPSHITNLSAMFYKSNLFNQDISGWDVSNVTSMDSMLFDCASLKSDLSKWCVSNIPKIPVAFFGNKIPPSPFKSPVWGTCPRGEDSDTVEMGLRADYSGSGWYKATDTGTVFNKSVPALETHVFSDSPKEYVSVYTKEDAKLYGERAAVSNMTAMNELFAGANSFNQDISSWDVSNVTDMTQMFYSATSFNQDISSWDVSSVNKVAYMFNYATSFNQDLSEWCVWLIPSKPIYFDSSTTSWTLPKPVWGTCPRGEAG